MTEIRAQCRIVTPAFLGGSHPQNADGLRGASIKGALRFWWRALNWARLYQKHSDAAKALKELHQEEAALFGAASGSKGGGQSKVLMRVEPGEDVKTGEPDANKLPDGLPYLLGQGVYHFKKGFLREALVSGRFTVRLLLHPRVTEEQRRQVADTLLAWGCLGGMGSRMRRGLGSVAIEGLEGGPRSAPSNLQELKGVLEELLPSEGELPPLSAFSGFSRVDVSLQGQDPWALLGKAGYEMQLYRSWGRNGKVNGQPAEQNFKDDHDLAQAAADGQRVDRLPQRSVFGFPHNYFFSSSKTKVDIAPAVKQRTRRASPLWIHAHQFPDGSAAIIHTLMPASFLPKGEPVQLKPKGKPQKVKWQRADWGVIHSYLDRFSSREPIQIAQGGSP